MKHSNASRRGRFTVAAGAGILLLHASANAQPLDALSTLNHAIAASQRADAQFLSRIFGDDPLSPIPMDFSYDTTALTFDYATPAGATYMGLPILLSGEGTYNDLADEWSVLVNAWLGGDSWSGQATIKETQIDEDRRRIDTDIEVPWLGGIVDYHEQNVITSRVVGAQTSVIDWQFTQNGSVVLSGTAQDRYVRPDPTKPEGEWRWISITFGSGSGIFTGTGGSATLTVPAPGSLMLLAIGSVAFTRKRRPS